MTHFYAYETPAGNTKTRRIEKFIHCLPYDGLFVIWNGISRVRIEGSTIYSMSVNGKMRKIGTNARVYL